MTSTEAGAGAEAKKEAEARTEDDHVGAQYSLWSSRHSRINCFVCILLTPNNLRAM